MTENKKYTCPHCGSELKKWQPPPATNWGFDCHLVCFNDDCPYYQKGWAHMEQNFQQRASYRYRLNPQTGTEGPLPVWSLDAHKDRIVE